MSEQTEKDKPETLQQTVKFFDNLLASLIDGVVITDESHNIIVVNDAFCNLLGRRRQEVIETNLFLWLDLLNAGIPPLWTEMTRRLYHEGSCRDVEFQVTTTHGMKYRNSSPPPPSGYEKNKYLLIFFSGIAAFHLLYSLSWKQP